MIIKCSYAIGLQNIMSMIYLPGIAVCKGLIQLLMMDVHRVYSLEKTILRASETDRQGMVHVTEKGRKTGSLLTFNFVYVQGTRFLMRNRIPL